MQRGRRVWRVCVVHCSSSPAGEGGKGKRGKGRGRGREGWALARAFTCYSKFTLRLLFLLPEKKKRRGKGGREGVRSHRAY